MTNLSIRCYVHIRRKSKGLILYLFRSVLRLTCSTKSTLGSTMAFQAAVSYAHIPSLVSTKKTCYSSQARTSCVKAV